MSGYISRNSPLLESPEAPWIVVDVLSGDEQGWLPSRLYSKSEGDCIIRKLRGKKMKSRLSLMDEFGAALQFFDDFGENWRALNECLRYLDEWLPGDAYIIVITDAELVLLNENPGELLWLIRTLNEVGEWWSKSITDNERFNRGPTPFHTILQCRPADLDEVLSRFGNPSFLE